MSSVKPPKCITNKFPYLKVGTNRCYKDLHRDEQDGDCSQWCYTGNSSMGVACNPVLNPNGPGIDDPTYIKNNNWIANPPTKCDDQRKTENLCTSLNYHQGEISNRKSGNNDQICFKNKSDAKKPFTNACKSDDWCWNYNKPIKDYPKCDFDSSWSVGRIKRIELNTTN